MVTFRGGKRRGLPRRVEQGPAGHGLAREGLVIDRAALPRWRGLALLGVLLVLAVLQGCATRLETTVTAFHEPALSWKGKTFTIVADERQRDSLEFKAYADRVSQALQRNGLIPASGARSDVDVKLQYQIVELPATRYSSPALYGNLGLYGGYGFYGPFWGLPYRGGLWGPGFGYYGVGPYWSVPLGYATTETRSYRNWRHELKVDIGSPGVARRQYEATATTDNQSTALANVMPALVEAIFHDFPGPNGQVRQLEIELREPTPQSSASQAPSK